MISWFKYFKIYIKQLYRTQRNTNPNSLPFTRLNSKRGIQILQHNLRYNFRRPPINEGRGNKFPCLAVVYFLAMPKAISINMIWELLENLLTLVRFPSKQSPGSNRKINPVILVSQKLYQKGLTFVQSQVYVLSVERGAVGGGNNSDSVYQTIIMGNLVWGPYSAIRSAF